MKNIIKIKKYIFAVVITAILFSFQNHAQNIGGEDIWMGFATNEYNGMSYGAVANDNEDEKLKIDGYGRYQFKHNTNLVDFLRFVDENYFKKWIEMGKGSYNLNKYEYGLPQAWTDYYVNNKDTFIEKQDRFFYENYYVPIESYFNQSNISLSEKSSYLKGAILSITVFRLNNNEINQTISRSSLIDLIDLYEEDDTKYIAKLYNMMIDRYSDEDLKKRWSKEKQACIDMQDDTFDSHIGEILNKKGEANSMTFIRELNNLNPTILYEFLSNEKFTRDDVLEWYDAVRKSVNYNEEFGISSGVLDFGTSTSRGINLNGYLDLIENEVVFKKPNNGSNIVYIPQNTNKASYSELRFGVNNIAQGGASLAVLSMALNKLYGNSNLIMPNDLYNTLLEKHGDVNYYYDEEKRGNKNEIIFDLAHNYGISCNTIAKTSVMSSLTNGKVVIARVAESEFTKYGTFILLCGVKLYNGKNYIIIADPNIYHTRYLYNLYDIDYLANTCKGIFFELSK